MAQQKMNIDMGDFFGGGGSSPQPASRKEATKSKGFNFGGLMSKKPATAVQASKPTKQQDDQDDFENPYTFTPQQSFRQKSTDTKQAAPVSGAPSPKVPTSPILSDGKGQVKSPVQEVKLLPRTGSMIRDPPKPQQFLPPPRSPSNASPPLASPKGMQTASNLTVLSSGAEASSASPSTGLSSPKGPPPPLPTRPLSPRAKDTLPVTSPAASTPSLPESKTAGMLPQTASAASLRTEANKTSAPSTPPPEAKPPQSITPPLTPIVTAVKATTTDAGLASLSANDALRSEVAPWTVWSEDPEKTLANEDLRSQVAPWLSEPEPEPKPPPEREQSRGESGDDSAAVTARKTIAMGAFFKSSLDDADFGEEEFENPLLKSANDDGADGEEEVMSKPALKKTWMPSSRTLDTGSGSTSPKPRKSTAPAKQQQQPEKKKVIDYGEIFKANDAADDDDANAFFNDPEFKDAPDFEW